MNHWCEKYILFSGELKGTEPQSMICKITGGYDRKLPFLYRLAFYFIVGGNVDDDGRWDFSLKTVSSKCKYVMVHKIRHLACVGDFAVFRNHSFKALFETFIFSQWMARK